jgi:Uma2 family endonuclease
MATDPVHIPSEGRRPLRRREYERLVDAGAFENERIELLYGVLLRMSPHGPPHDATIEQLTELFVGIFRGRARVRVQSAFAASDESEPEPDIAIVPLGDYSREHPTKAHLIVEVAASSLPVDRGVKARLYAECGVPEYWVVNVVDGLIEVHAAVVRGAYTRVTPFRRGESIRLIEFGDVEIAVADVLR